jgi:hypothetical protein
MEASKNVAVTSSVVTSAPTTCIDPSALTFKIFEQLTAGAAPNDFDNWVLEQDGKVVASGDTELQDAMDSQEGEVEGAHNAYARSFEPYNRQANGNEDDSDDGIDLSGGPDIDDGIDLGPVPAPGGLRPVPQQRHVRCCIHTATEEQADLESKRPPPDKFYPGYGTNFTWHKFGCDNIIQCRSDYLAQPMDLGQLLGRMTPGVRPGIGQTPLRHDSCVRIGPTPLMIPVGGRQPAPAPLKDIMASLGCQDFTDVSLRHGWPVGPGVQDHGHWDANTAVLAAIDMLKAGTDSEVSQLACHAFDNSRLKCEQAQFFRDLLAGLCKNSGSRLTITGRVGAMRVPLGGRGCSIQNPAGGVGPQNAWHMRRVVVTENGWIACRLGLNGWEEDDTYCGNLFKGQGNMTAQPTGRNPRLKCS